MQDFHIFYIQTVTVYLVTNTVILFFFLSLFFIFLCPQKQNLVNSIFHAYKVHVAQLDKLQALIQTDKIHNKNTRSMQRILSEVYLYTIWLLLYPLMSLYKLWDTFFWSTKTWDATSSYLADRLFLLYVVMFIVQWLVNKNRLCWFFCPLSLTSSARKICPQGKQELSTSML